MSGWEKILVGDDAHGRPEADLREHELSETCWCKPSTEDVFDDNGFYCGRMVVHNAMDGREEYENGRKPH